MQSVKLSNGHSMPVFGLGTWLSKPGEVGQAVKIALSNGYKLVDCAQAYENQAEIGDVLNDLFDSRVVKREDVFITSKVWNTFHSFELALKSVESTLAELNIDYLDLCLIHWPMGYKEGGALFPKEGDKMLFSDVDYLDTWKAMEQKVKEGKIRSIGLSNFSIKQIQRVIENCEIKPVALQVELHPYFQQKELHEFCNKNSIAVTAYSPLANPAMPFHKPTDPNVMHDPVINEIAKNHRKSNAQVVLKFLVQKGICVIPKSVSESRIKENKDIWDFTLTDEEMSKMKGLDRNLRFLDLKPRDGHHPHFPW